MTCPIFDPHCGERELAGWGSDPLDALRALEAVQRIRMGKMCSTATRLAGAYFAKRLGACGPLLNAPRAGLAGPLGAIGARLG